MIAVIVVSPSEFILVVRSFAIARSPQVSSAKMMNVPSSPTAPCQAIPVFIFPGLLLRMPRYAWASGSVLKSISETFKFKIQHCQIGADRAHDPQKGRYAQHPYN